MGSLFGVYTLKTGLCVGMKTNGHTKWLLLSKRHTTLMAIFSVTSLMRLTLGRSEWKSLINGSSMHVSYSAR